MRPDAFLSTNNPMARQLMSTTKKRGRPATGKGKSVHVRMHEDELAPLDAWIEAQPAPKPTRSEAIRAFVEAGLRMLKKEDSQ